MKTVLFLLALFLSINSYGQHKQLSNYAELQKVFSSIKKRDTFIVKGVYLSFGKASKESLLDTLQRKGYIKKQNFKTSIAFNLYNNEERYYQPIDESKKGVTDQLIDAGNKGKPVVLNIVIFPDFKYHQGKYFFLIDKIAFL